MSLAQELQDDLDLLEGNSDDESYDQDQTTQPSTDSVYMEDEDGSDDREDMADVHEEQSERERIEKIAMGDVNDVKKIAKLWGSRAMQDVLKKIALYKEQARDYSQPVAGPVEEDPEYKLIVQANNLAVDIDNEVLSVHKFIRDHYAPKFPELESLVLNPLDYARAVKAIANEMDITHIDLRPLLPSATVMVITVTATTTNGKPLSPAEWKITEEACDMALSLDAAKKTIIEYVESRMHFIAPNLSAVVGSSTAAKLMGVAGGLTALSKIPSCNVQVLGRSQKASTGLSNISQKRHTGYIYQSELVSRAPQELRMKLQRIIAAKVVLAARIDLGHQSSDGQLGQRMRDELESKIEKLQEAPNHKMIKALPAPDDPVKKRRGGRRARGQKEAYAITELRRQQNRMAFCEAEDETGSMDSTKGLGVIGHSTGRIRAAIADTRTRVKTPKQKHYGSSTATSGLSSSLAFTPVQGIELVDPTLAAERVRHANDRYFGGGGFLNVNNPAKNGGGSNSKK